MQFIFDQSKSEANLLKHGIDFLKAQRLWDDPERLRRRARSGTETRSMLIGQIDGRMWTAIYTERDGSIRIISVRRSRRDEVGRYEEDLNG